MPHTGVCRIAKHAEVLKQLADKMHKEVDAIDYLDLLKKPLNKINHVPLKAISLYTLLPQSSLFCLLKML